MTIGLGIDAGGTYTDAVIFDLKAKRVLAKAKALTTYHNLVDGIRGALGQLPAEMLGQVRATSLSTTLATNAIVEGRGYKVGLIALSPWDWTEEQIGHRPVVNIRGHVAITGEVSEPIDEAECVEAIRRLVKKDRCAAIVVAGYALTRNPEQANRVREIAQDMFDLPVVCAHEVSRRLNGVQAAQTAVANAKLLPLIQNLIDSVRLVLGDFNVSGKLMVVKGDGTPVDEGVARALPVETILSGPAASVSGARILSGFEDALVLDIGGTTTDCAIIENGHVAVAPQGARVGPWVMSVDAVEISTIGLGGDSRIDFDHDGQLTIGPMRSIPISYLAAEHESVMSFLTSFNIARHIGDFDASALDVLVKGSEADIDLTDSERALVGLLACGTMPAITAARRLGLQSHILLPTARLEACGMIKRSALTPTDILHITDSFTRWSVAGAKRALDIFSAIYRKPADDVLRMVRNLITRRLFEEIVLRELSFEDKRFREIPPDWAPMLDRVFDGSGKGLAMNLVMGRPLVAVGAPAEALVPAVAEHMEIEVVIPEHADVANAVGAIGAEVVVREDVLIRHGTTSNYVLHVTSECIAAHDLGTATEQAETIARARAIERAISAGAGEPDVKILREDSTGTTSNGDQIFLDRRIIAIASGAAFALVN